MKTKTTLLIILVISSITMTYAQVGFGTTNPHSSAIVEVKSTAKGFLPPRLTQNQRKSIISPAVGLMIYNLDRHCIQMYNGTFWMDLCCTDVVNSGIDALPILLRVDPSQSSSFSKINANGSNSNTPVVLDEFVHTIITSPDGVALSYVPGANETSNGNHNIFKYEEETSLIPYKQKKFISRTQSISGGSVSRISYDFIPDRQDEFEIFVVGKMDNSVGNIVDYASFFAGADNSNDQYSLQLGVGSGSTGCTSDYYRVLYSNGSSGRALCTNIPNNIIRSDDGNLHTFNIISRDHPDQANHPNKVVLSLLVDGMFIDSDSNMDNHIKFEEFKLFSNRNSDNASKSSIGELVFFDSPLDETQRETLNQFLLCKYGEE
ncbi:MAG: hypothetical protein ACPG6V_12215 [Flavobacteriales bacterium]